MSPKMPIREVQHTADRAFRVYGYDLPALFSHAAQAICGTESTQLELPLTVNRYVELSAIDFETLLVKWLNELLYLEEVHEESYSRYEVTFLSRTRLCAWIRGMPARDRRQIIKAVTFNDLEVKRLGDGWEATIVVDV